MSVRKAHELWTRPFKSTLLLERRSRSTRGKYSTGEVLETTRYAYPRPSTLSFIEFIQSRSKISTSILTHQSARPLPPDCQPLVPVPDRPFEGCYRAFVIPVVILNLNSSLISQCTWKPYLPILISILAICLGRSLIVHNRRFVEIFTKVFIYEFYSMCYCYIWQHYNEIMIFI